MYAIPNSQKFLRRSLASAFVFLSSFVTVTNVVTAASVAPVEGQKGMVVTAQHLATNVGVDILKKGGTAIDAAVAVGYALAVVYPAAGNLGGGGFITLQLANGQKTFIDFREMAPLAATSTMFLDKEGKVIPGLSTKTHLAVGVPGTVAGLEYIRQKYGKMSRQALIKPAIQLAEKGFILDHGDVILLQSAQDDLKKDPASKQIFLKKGEQPYQVGDRLVQKDLANTLKTISQFGADGFYKGTFAKNLVKASQQGGGIITLADLSQYTVRELPPVECDYRSYHVISAPPPSSGGVVLCEILNILEGYPLKELGFRSAQSVHYQIEAMRHSYADRNAYLGDPDFVQNPIDRLLDKTYAAKIRDAIDPNQAGISQAIKPGVSSHEGSNTTHYSIADQWGNVTSVTYTLNDWFGNRITVPGTGVLLNNEMDDFTAKVNEPNLYGLVQGEANIIAPLKRPLSSMTPTIITTKEGKPLLVIGTPGGSRIITSTLLTILNLIDYDMDLQEAVDAPRFHQQWLPEITNVERFAISPDTRQKLEAMGHHFGPPQPANHIAAILMGGPSLPAIQKENNQRFYGANDPRRRSGLSQGF